MARSSAKVAAVAVAAAACFDVANAFSPLSVLPAGTNTRVQARAAAPLALRAHADSAEAAPLSRRAAALRLAVLAGVPALLPNQAVFAESEVKEKKEKVKTKKEKDAEYEDDLSGMKQV